MPRESTQPTLIIDQKPAFQKKEARDLTQNTKALEANMETIRNEINDTSKEIMDLKEKIDDLPIGLKENIQRINLKKDLEKLTEKLENFKEDLQAEEAELFKLEGKSHPTLVPENKKNASRSNLSSVGSAAGRRANTYAGSYGGGRVELSSGSLQQDIANSKIMEEAERIGPIDVTGEGAKARTALERSKQQIEEARIEAQKNAKLLSQTESNLPAVSSAVSRRTPSFAHSFSSGLARLFGGSFQEGVAASKKMEEAEKRGPQDIEGVGARARATLEKSRQQASEIRTEETAENIKLNRELDDLETNLGIIDKEISAKEKELENLAGENGSEEKNQDRFDEISEELKALKAEKAESEKDLQAKNSILESKVGAQSTAQATKKSTSGFFSKLKGWFSK